MLVLLGSAVRDNLKIVFKMLLDLCHNCCMLQPQNMAIASRTSINEQTVHPFKWQCHGHHVRSPFQQKQNVRRFLWHHYAEMKEAFKSKMGLRFSSAAGNMLHPVSTTTPKQRGLYNPIHCTSSPAHQNSQGTISLTCSCTTFWIVHIDLKKATLAEVASTRLSVSDHLDCKHYNAQHAERKRL